MNKTTTHPVFEKSMKATHTILIPTMLPMHFALIRKLLAGHGYRTEVLDDSGAPVVQRGLRYVHNDTCYPALIVIGQFLAALDSGRFDPHRVALLITQTGGGCRASNYITLLRKALVRAGYGYIPVISLNVSGLEKAPGFRLTPALGLQMLQAVQYGDLLMLLRNQCQPYETVPGMTQALCDSWIARLGADLSRRRGLSRRARVRYIDEMLEDFAALPLTARPAVLVGIVGEIFVKFSPLGNNDLEAFLQAEGAEVVMPGLLDFCLYCVYNNLVDATLYRTGRIKTGLFSLAYRFLLGRQKECIARIRAHGRFRAPTPFDHVPPLREGYVGLGAKMGEGWLLTAEMLELIDQGVDNIICTQPFGCLPNHIVGKGMMGLIKQRHPQANIVAIDYDPGASQINQQNRVKLMLANAHKAAKAALDKAKAATQTA